MIPFYIEENGVPKEVDMATWTKWIESEPNRVVKQTLIDGEKIQVITVFFPVAEIDLDFDRESDKPPKEIHYLYGTLVRGSRINGHEEKYRSRKEAEEGHEKIVVQVKAVEAGGEIPECCQNG